MLDRWEGRLYREKGVPIVPGLCVCARMCVCKAEEGLQYEPSVHWDHRTKAHVTYRSISVSMQTWPLFHNQFKKLNTHCRQQIHHQPSGVVKF